jgi:hydroxyacylglutathione hydrolase
MLVKQIRIESLGNSSYIVGSPEAKLCAVIDPARDVDLYIREADSLGMKIAYALETHLHNDFISGSRELAARTGCPIAASAVGGLAFDHRPLKPGDSIDIGEVRLQVIATPGHTPEHISFQATDTSKGSGPHALFSGGALMVGGVARSDLLGKQLAPFLGRWFHRTITREFKPLDDAISVYPTHGGGSFCMASAGNASRADTTTIGQERRTNPFFMADSEEEFLQLALGDLPSYPAYYKRMSAINRQGPKILGWLPQLFPLSPKEVWTRVQGEGVAIDTRKPEAFAAGHIPRAYSITAGDTLGTWVGWLVEPGKPLVFVLDDPSKSEDLVRQLIRIGYDSLDGYLDGGMDSWRKARLPVSTLKTASAQELYRQIETGHGPQPLDVRFAHEWQGGHVPGALKIELGDLPEHTGGLPRDMAYAAVCAAGFRASTAASILQREGFDDVTLLVGGNNAWKKEGLPLEGKPG